VGCVLLQEADANNPRDFYGKLLVVGEYVRTDQTDNLHQAVLLNENGQHFFTKLHKILADILLVPVRKVADVFRVAVVQLMAG
jgi:hypothetical protein